MTRLLTRTALALLPLVLAPACYEREEGCLDINAVNYNASADDNCCCTYPTLSFSVQHRMDTLVWQRDSVYQTTDGQWFRLLDAAFYLSEFSLRQNNQAYRISDSLLFQVFASGGTDTVGQFFIDDFTLLRRTTTSLSVGTFSADGAFDQAQFRLGLSESANRIIPALTPDGHPLRTQGDSLWLNPQDGYVPLYLVLDRDTLSATPPDTLRFTRSEIGDAFATSAGPFYHEPGYNLALKIRINYLELFAGVNLSNPDINAVRNGIASNLPKAFSVIP